MKFSGKVCNGPTNKRLNFGGDPDHRLDTFSGFVIIGRHEKWLTDINLLLILIQMAALARREMAEVCSVPVLLVFFFPSTDFLTSLIKLEWLLVLLD